MIDQLDWDEDDDDVQLDVGANTNQINYVIDGEANGADVKPRRIKIVHNSNNIYPLELNIYN